MEAIVVCEESGPISLSYNALLTTPEVNIVIKPIVVVTTTKPSVQPIIVNEMVELAINQPTTRRCQHRILELAFWRWNVILKGG